MIIPPSTISSTLPRNVFSSRDQPGCYEASNQLPSDSLPNPGRSMPARSKTLGPGFMRGAAGGKRSGYVSSPDSGGPDLPSMRLTSRFSAIPEGNYHGKTSTTLYIHSGTEFLIKLLGLNWSGIYVKVC